MKRQPNDESGQASVELAIVLPVLLVAMVIVIDAMTFMGECARFDHMAAQAVLAQGASAPAGEYGQDARIAAVRGVLDEQFSGSAMGVTVEACDGGGFSPWGATAFTCTLEMAPWPLSRGGATVFGMKVPTSLTHSYTLVVEAYTPGRL